ncbi:hypothetical protein ENSA5_27310 [Enhygromyxa salina]|uniref:Uncharacterized protein n=1 Tax=Enhygromyxa salina TaxID=215803 RepID=A0A2S9Y7H5_9BACT|nr:hypothetical protein [Enhygromyxa salina]PRQ01049.1 hypothetical protein ENSA5_27310 [Enhygromyxa salina]
MSHTVDLAFEGTLESFFFEQLRHARAGKRDTLGEDIEAYLVYMLAAHARRTNVAGRTSPALATEFLAAREHGSRALREVGDRALYIAGVVPRSLDRGPVNVAYVSGIGEAAYRELHVRSARLQVFARLADRFREIVALLGRMIAADDGAEGDLLTVYERWRRTSDPRDAERLVAAGVLLDPEIADLVQ